LRNVRADGAAELSRQTGMTQLPNRTERTMEPSAARRAVEQEAAFQKLVKWRTGPDGRISCLKRDFGWNRTRNDGLEGTRTWCGHGVFNHNLIKIAALIGEE
jgi:transposase, IS5 family